LPIRQSGGAHGSKIYIVLLTGIAEIEGPYNKPCGIKIRFWERLGCICRTGLL